MRRVKSDPLRERLDRPARIDGLGSIDADQRTRPIPPTTIVGGKRFIKMSENFPGSFQPSAHLTRTGEKRFSTDVGSALETIEVVIEDESSQHRRVDEGRTLTWKAALPAVWRSR